MAHLWPPSGSFPAASADCLLCAPKPLTHHLTEPSAGELMQTCDAAKTTGRPTPNGWGSVLCLLVPGAASYSASNRIGATLARAWATATCAFRCDYLTAQAGRTLVSRSVECDRDR